MSTEGPNDGHTFEIHVCARGSYAAPGQPHQDAGFFGDPAAVRVRAWDLRAALLKAAETPLVAWAWPLTDMVDE